MRTRLCLLPAAFAVALLAAAPAEAQWVADPAVNLTVADRPAGQAQPKLVPTADGGFYLSWFGSVADGFDVSLQRLDSDGVAQWAANGVTVADRSYSSTEDYGLALDSEGNALLAFRFPDSGGHTQAVAQRITPAGTLLWPAPGVFVSADVDAAASPRIIGTNGGSSVVAWTSYDSGDIVLQKIDANGAPQWGAGVTLALPSGTFFIADLQADADGNVIVSGSAQLSFNSRRLWAQKLAAADGAPMWGANPVEVFNGVGGAMQLGYFPPFVPDGSGGGVFAWYHVSGVSDASVRVQHVLANGTQVFPQNGAEAATGGDRRRYAPSAAYDAATGSTYVVWPEEHQVGGGPRTYGVSAQRLDATGARQWGDLGQELVALGDQQASQVSALLMDGDGVFAWSLGSSPSPMRLEAARLDPDGDDVWPGGVVALKTATTANSRMRGALSADGFAAYVWGDGAGSGDGNLIKAQNVNADGTLGATGTATEGGPTPAALTLLPARPNPSAGTTTLTYALPEAAHVRVEVLDALGRRVAVLVDEAQGAGTHTAVWDAGALPAGLYVAHLRAGAASARVRMAVAR